RLAFHGPRWLLVGGAQDAEQLVFQHALQFVYVADLFAVDLLAQSGEHLLGGGVAEVGGEQCGFQVVEGLAVDLFAEADDVVNALAQVLTRARDRVAHAVEQPLLLLFRGRLFEAAEQRLDLGLAEQSHAETIIAARVRWPGAGYIRSGSVLTAGITPVRISGAA